MATCMHFNLDLLTYDFAGKYKSKYSCHHFQENDHSYNDDVLPRKKLKSTVCLVNNVMLPSQLTVIRSPLLSVITPDSPVRITIKATIPVTRTTEPAIRGKLPEV